VKQGITDLLKQIAYVYGNTLEWWEMCWTRLVWQKPCCKICNQQHLLKSKGTNITSLNNTFKYEF